MRFFREIKKYSYYMYYAAYANLKSQVNGSYLNWAWWILEPLGITVVYSIIFGIFFKQGIEHFPLFVIIGNMVWGFFSRVANSSVTLMKQNEQLLSRIYIPKYIVLFVEMCINTFKMMIQFGIVIVLMIVYRISISPNVFWVIPILIVLFLVTFGICSLLMNWGVFLEDLGHAMSIILTIWMYFSGIFYNFKAVLQEPLSSIVVAVNPIANFIVAMRDSLMYSNTPDLFMLLGWFVGGLILAALGIRAIYRNENSYIKRI